MTDISQLTLQVTGIVARLSVGTYKHEQFKTLVSILDKIENSFLQNKLEATKYRKKCSGLQQQAFGLNREIYRLGAELEHLRNLNAEEGRNKATLEQMKTTENIQLEQNIITLQDEDWCLKTREECQLDTDACLDFFNENTPDFS